MLSKGVLMARKVWMRSPGVGGRKIPEDVQRRTEQRIRRYAEKHFQGKYTRLDIRFRRQFCYIDAYVEPFVPPGWPPKGWHETRKQHLERLRDTPLHLCRLRYFGEDRWGFAFFAYSSEKYELSVFPSGNFYGTPEEAMAAAGGAYLTEG
jgi:hypothetical protein